MSEPINALAKYLTGHRVAICSMGLQLGGRAGADAEAFFALRQSFGVSGYATAEEAETTIQAALANSTPADARDAEASDGTAGG